MSTRSKTSTEGIETIDKTEVPDKRKKSGTLTNQVSGAETNLETARPKRITKRKLVVSEEPEIEVLNVPKTQKQKNNAFRNLLSNLRHNKSLLNSKAVPFDAVQAHHDREIQSSKSFAANPTGTKLIDFDQVLAREEAKRKRDLLSEKVWKEWRSKHKNEKQKNKRIKTVQSKIIRHEGELSEFEMKKSSSNAIIYQDDEDLVQNLCPHKDSDSEEEVVISRRKSKAAQQQSVQVDSPVNSVEEKPVQEKKKRKSKKVAFSNTKSENEVNIEDNIDSNNAKYCMKIKCLN